MTRKSRITKISALGVASGLFVGYFPLAPGTAGSALGCGIVWVTREFSIVFYVVLTVVLFAAGVWASNKTSQILNKPDPSVVVIDEIVGMMVTMVGIPITGYWLVCGFLLFRFFDIVKIPPVNWIDSKLKNGWGVMLDDVMAGVYGNILLQLMHKAYF